MSFTAPDISVVMATYNGEKYLKQQLDSILLQTISPKEIIIVDDGSTDNTVAILKTYAQDDRVRLIINEKNIGYIRSFEKGMLSATYSFVALSDQDDIWFPQKLETLFLHIQNNIAVYSDSILIDENGTSLHKKMSDIKNQLTYDNCLMYAIGAWAPGHAMLFRKELIEKCIPFPTIVTHDFWLGFVASCYGGIKYVNEVLVQYRQHTHNAIGANTRQHGKPKSSISNRIDIAKQRMELLFEKCPGSLPEQKRIFEILATTYRQTDVLSRWKRMITFFKYRDVILAYKKKSAFMKILFCIKMFFKIDA